MDTTTRAVVALVTRPVLGGGSRDPEAGVPLEVEDALRVVDVLWSAGVPPTPLEG